MLSQLLSKLSLSVRHYVSRLSPQLLKLLHTHVSPHGILASLKNCVCAMSLRLLIPLMRNLKLVWRIFPVLQAIRKCLRSRGDIGVSLRSMRLSQQSYTLGVLQPQRARMSLLCDGGLQVIARKGGWLTHTLYKRSLWPLLWYLRQGPLKSLKERSLIVLSSVCGERLLLKPLSRLVSDTRWCLSHIGRGLGLGPGGKWWVSLIFRGTRP
uniref:p23 protein n=1 Tax=Hibiscus chlorotic ringspot virus TaxID=53181 RepID=R9UNN1_9TOMB|nr:P23 protein [Hibiscus chlorotic ringspot virus]